MNSGYLHFPEFDPVIFSVGPVSLHWYGLMYLVGFIFAMWLAGRRASRPGSGWTKNEVENLLYAGFLGVFLGGRIGYVLFIILNLFIRKPRPMGAVSGLFLIGYGAFRIIVEFFRQPDAQFTGEWVQYISMGQILSIPMIVAGAIMMIWAYRRRPQQQLS